MARLTDRARNDIKCVEGPQNTNTTNQLMIPVNIIKCTIPRYSVVGYSNTVLTKIGTCRNSDTLQLCAAPRHQ